MVRQARCRTRLKAKAVMNESLLIPGDYLGRADYLALVDRVARLEEESVTHLREVARTCAEDVIAHAGLCGANRDRVLRAVIKRLEDAIGR